MTRSLSTQRPFGVGVGVSDVRWSRYRHRSPSSETACEDNGVRKRISQLALASALVLTAPTFVAEVATGATHGSTPSSPCGVRGVVAHYDHVVWIVLENVGNSVVGSPDAPYLNGLGDKCALATNDFAISHPSLPNYVALTSGSTLGVADDGEPSVHPLRAPNIFSQLHGNWRTLAESMPQPCDRATNANYVARHNPAVYYANLGVSCLRNDVALSAPLNVSAAFTFIAPNICHDMHSCAVSNGDQWLARYVPSILASELYLSGRLVLFITFDENDTQPTNRVPTWVIAPTVPRGERVGVALTHYSLLRTTETLLRLPLLGAAGTAPSMVGPFHLK
jgi:hypothetical protein